MRESTVIDYWISRIPRGAMAAILAFAPVSILWAQDEANLRVQCDIAQLRAQTELVLDPYWASHHPDSIFVRLAQSMARRDWGGAIDSIREVAATHRIAGHLESTEYARIDAELAEDAALLREILADAERLGRQAARAVRWHPVGDDQRPRYDIFAGPDPVGVTEELPVARMRALCWTALATERVLTLHNSAARIRVERELGRLDALWDRYAERGYAQLPWELLLNAFTTMRTGGLEPPRTQFVLMHPEPAMQIAGGRYPDWRGFEALSVGLFGILFYNESRGSHFGTTATLVASSSEPVGYGVTTIIGRGVSIGYVRRNSAAATTKNGFLISAEVYQFLSGIPDMISGKKREALKALMRRDVAGGGTAP